MKSTVSCFPDISGLEPESIDPKWPIRKGYLDPALTRFRKP